MPITPTPILPTTLETVLAEVGEFVALIPPREGVAGPNAGERPVRGVEIFDPTPGARPDHTDRIVLLTGGADRAFRRSVDAYKDAAALILPPGASAETLNPYPGTVLLERSRWISWSDLHVLLRRVIAAGEGDRAAAYSTVTSLQELAGVIADITGASITLEDPRSRVLAYSATSTDADPIRQQTILGGAVPAWRVAELTGSGFLRAVRESRDVVERPATATEPARSVIAVRVDGEFVGSIWAAGSTLADPEALRRTMREAGRAAAPLYLRETLHARYLDSRRNAVLSGLLVGGVDPRQAAHVLDLPIHQSYVVLTLDDPSGSARSTVTRFHVSSAFPGTVFSHSETLDRALVPLTDPELTTPGLVATAVERLLARALPSGARLRIAVGRIVSGLDDVAVSAEESSIIHTLMVEAQEAPTQRSTGERTVVARCRADLSPAFTVRSLVRGRIDDRTATGFTAPFDTLREYDAEHGTDLADTLAAYVDHVGSAARAAKELMVHSNSLRYRLRRIEELTGLDLTRSADRTVTAIGLELIRDRARASG